MKLMKGNAECDYHKTFNTKLFMKWFKDKLIPNLPGVSLICMDNAS
jgi:hypothetical protein